MNIFTEERPTLPCVFPTRVLPRPQDVCFLELEKYDEMKNYARELSYTWQSAGEVQNFLFGGKHQNSTIINSECVQEFLVRT